jgi:hypothetical protein
LNHPHIWALHDVGRHDGLTFLMMELLEGTTLAHEVGKGPLQITRAIDIAVQMRMRSERSWQILATTPTRIWWVADSRMSSRRFLLRRTVSVSTFSPGYTGRK